MNKLLIDDPDTHHKIRFLNSIINKANSLSENPVYVLESDTWGSYMAPEVAWHESEFFIAIRRLDAVHFIEFLAEVVEDGTLDPNVANDLLTEAESSVRLEERTNQRIFPVVTPPNGAIGLDAEANPNLRTLIARMDHALAEGDYSDALSNSASALEVISKEVMGTLNISNQTLGSYINGYKSALPCLHQLWIRYLRSTSAGTPNLWRDTVTLSSLG